MSWKGTSTSAVIQDLLGVPVRARLKEMMIVVPFVHVVPGLNVNMNKKTLFRARCKHMSKPCVITLNMVYMDSDLADVFCSCFRCLECLSFAADICLVFDVWRPGALPIHCKLTHESLTSEIRFVR